METLQTTDVLFKAKGATHYHDSLYPNRYNWQTSRYDLPGSLFSRHYFRNGVELGYVLPDMLPVGTGIHHFDTPRIWGIRHTLAPL